VSPGGAPAVTPEGLFDVPERLKDPLIRFCCSGRDQAFVVGRGAAFPAAGPFVLF